MAVFRVFSGVDLDALGSTSLVDTDATFTVLNGQITDFNDGAASPTTGTLGATDRFSILIADTAGETDFDGDDVGADGVNDRGSELSEDPEEDQIAFIVDGLGGVSEDAVEFYLEATFEFSDGLGGPTFIGYHVEAHGASGGGNDTNLIILPAGVPDGDYEVDTRDASPDPDAVDYSDFIQGDQDVDISNFASFEQHTDGADTLEGGTGSDTFDGGFLNDSLSGSDGDDSLTGNFGQDTLIGGEGADTLIGDNDSTVIDRQVLSWADLGFADEDALSSGNFDAGLIDVGFNLTSEDRTTNFSFETNTISVVNINDDGNAVDSGSSVEVLAPTGGTGTDLATIELTFTPDDTDLFESNVTDVSFNITEIDQSTFQDSVTIRAFDADNNQIAVTLTPGADIATSDTDTVVGDDTADADGAGASPSDAASTITVDVAGPVTRIEIDYNDLADAGDGQRIFISDIYFDIVTNEVSAFDDSIEGGAGTDSIEGGEGADTIDGGADADTITGGIGDDVITGGAGSDTIDAGDGDDALTGDANDTLTGGAGADEFIITDQDSSAIEITDFDDATGITGAFDTDQSVDQTDNDFVDLSGFFSNLRDARAADTSGGAANADLDLGGGQTLTITGLAAADFTFETTNLVCFVRDSQILTDKGEVAVQDLSIGDKIETRDNGLQTIRWKGARLAPAAGALAPIAFAAGVLGNAEVLRVSPLHRILVQGWRAEMLFGEREVLVAAKHLVNGDSVYVDAGGVVEYHHILFDNHEIIYANGVPTESLHPGRESIDGFGAEAREEIFTLFPELRNDLDSYGPMARSCLKGYEAKVLSDNPGFLS